jgi:hypothetical protein
LSLLVPQNLSAAPLHPLSQAPSSPFCVLGPGTDNASRTARTAVPAVLKCSRRPAARCLACFGKGGGGTRWASFYSRATTSPTLAILQPVLVMTASGKCHRDTCITCVRTDGSGQSGHRIPQATGLRSRDKPTLRSCHPHHTPDVETASRVQALPIPVLIFGDGSLLAHSRPLGDRRLTLRLAF